MLRQTFIQVKLISFYLECGTLSDLLENTEKHRQITWSQKLHIVIQLAEVSGPISFHHGLNLS